MLSAWIIGGEICGNVRIGFRVPNLIINAIGNPRQPITAGAHQPIKAVTLLRRLNLSSVTWADSGKSIGRQRAGSQSGRRSVRNKLIPFVAESQPPKVLRVEQALIGEIMNGKNNFGRSEE